MYPDLSNDVTLQPDYWKDVDNQRKWIKRVEKQLDIKSPKDWSSITTRVFTELGGKYLLNIYRTIRNTLSICM